MKTFYRSLLFTAILALFCAVPSRAQACDTETIKSVNNDGEIIILLDGSVWESLDPSTSFTWLAYDDVLVCNDEKIINTDEDGEEVDVTRIR